LPPLRCNPARSLFPQLHFDYVLDRLDEKGYITDAAHSLTREAAAFWSLLNVDPQLVSDRLPQTKVFVTTIGAVDAQNLIAALQAVGISVQPEEPTSGVNSLWVVLTDDYLQPELSRINKMALQTQQPWLLIKPNGGIPWFGSIFTPKETGCWECLAH
jgi:oxazoline/thiazoline synthase